MTDPAPTYSFLAWLRTGIANNIVQGDGDTNVKVRASLPLDLTITASQLDGSPTTQPLHRDVQLYGPGDVLGVESRAIVKLDPRNWITNFEPNYLPYIDFYDEDFPWRYVPAAADGTKHRLRPWIALVVLAEGEFKDGQNVQGKPLQYIELAAGVKAEDVFPRPSELWAWTHVHVNTDLTANGDASMPGVLQRLEATIADNPDRAYSRIMCPRRLEPDVDYHAFLVPTFETGRLAGLGEDVPDTTFATQSAWESNQTQFPYYFRWQFRTSDFGDFEYLVKLLKPRVVDKHVGVRDMDVVHPGSNLPKIDTPAELGDVLKLGGALRVPFDTLPPADQQEVTKYDQWDEPFPHPFETAIARLINLADDYSHLDAATANPTGDPDPVVTSPLYGRWHALVDRVLEARDHSLLPNDRNWVHKLNLDPRYRVSGGLGTKVVQQNDEQYVNAAWQQVGDVLEANNRIRLAQLAQVAALSWYGRHVASRPAEQVFVLTAPLHPRVVAPVGNPEPVATTLAAQVRESLVPPVVASAPFRKLVRPGTALAKRLDLAPHAAAAVVAGVNARDLLPAPPKVAPAGAIGIDDAADALIPSNEPPAIRKLLHDHPWLRFLPLALLVLVVLLAILLALFVSVVVVLAVAVPLAAALAGAYVLLTRWARAGVLSDSIREEEQTPESVDALPTVYMLFVLLG